MQLWDAVEWLNGSHQVNLHNVLVVRRDALAFEHYRNGADERWGCPSPEATHGPETKQDLRSASSCLFVGPFCDFGPASADEVLGILGGHLDGAIRANAQMPA
jgi:hypothetical protein